MVGIERDTGHQPVLESNFYFDNPPNVSNDTRTCTIGKARPMVVFGVLSSKDIRSNNSLTCVANARVPVSGRRVKECAVHMKLRQKPRAGTSKLEKSSNPFGNHFCHPTNGCQR